MRRPPIMASARRPRRGRKSWWDVCPVPATRRAFGLLDGAGSHPVATQRKTVPRFDGRLWRESGAAASQRPIFALVATAPDPRWRRRMGWKGSNGDRLAGARRPFRSDRRTLLRRLPGVSPTKAISGADSAEYPAGALAESSSDSSGVLSGVQSAHRGHRGMPSRISPRPAPTSGRRPSMAGSGHPLRPRRAPTCRRVGTKINRE